MCDYNQLLIKLISKHFKNWLYRLYALSLRIMRRKVLGPGQDVLGLILIPPPQTVSYLI